MTCLLLSIDNITNNNEPPITINLLYTARGVGKLHSCPSDHSPKTFAIV